jgi:hypothetical protein
VERRGSVVENESGEKRGGHICSHFVDVFVLCRPSSNHEDMHFLLSIPFPLASCVFSVCSTELTQYQWGGN